MHHVVFGCHSTSPDRLHNLIVLEVDDALKTQLARRRRVFDRAAQDEPGLYAHEYRGGPVSYLFGDDGEFFDAPDGVTGLDAHLGALEVSGPWRLEDAPGVYLKVVKEGFFYTWEGQAEAYGADESYESVVFTLADVEAAT